MIGRERYKVEQNIIKRIAYFCFGNIAIPSLRRYWFAIDMYKKFGGGVILDFGCGHGDLAFYLLNKYKNLIVYCIDARKNVVDEISKIKNSRHKERLFINHSDNIKESNQKYDLIFMLDVLEHVENYSMILQQANNVLKKNGKLIISTPLAEREDNEIMKTKEYVPYEDHVFSGFSRKLLNNILIKAGFAKCDYFSPYGKLSKLASDLFFRLSSERYCSNTSSTPQFKKYPIKLLLLYPFLLLLNMLDKYIRINESPEENYVVAYKG